tara:strand:- start:2377 stop:2553 length:177 start_codon:yes stop_codon:yes gene_type:complete
MSNKSNNINFIEEYKESLSEQEHIVLQIAIEHLESSFDIEKSIGFLEWLSKHNENSNK